MQTSLFAGLVLFPPKFFGEWSIMIPLLPFAAKITVSISSVTCCSLVASVSPELRVLLKAWRLRFPALLLGWFVNHSDQQVGCVAIVFLLIFRIYSLTRSRGCGSVRCESKSDSLIRSRGCCYSLTRSWILGMLFGLMRIKKQGWNETSRVFIRHAPKFKITSPILNFQSAFPAPFTPRSASKQYLCQLRKIRQGNF